MDAGSLYPLVAGGSAMPRSRSMRCDTEAGRCSPAATSADPAEHGIRSTDNCTTSRGGSVTRAAVLTAVDTPLEVREDVELAAPGPGEIRVRTGASGVCHSDLSVTNGTIPLPT